MESALLKPLMLKLGAPVTWPTVHDAVCKADSQSQSRYQQAFEIIIPVLWLWYLRLRDSIRCAIYK